MIWLRKSNSKGRLPVNLVTAHNLRYNRAMNFKTLLSTSIISISLLTQPVFAKNKNGFDVEHFRKEVKNNEVVYQTSAGNKIVEIETSAAFLQKEYDASGNSIYQREYSKEGKLMKEGRLAKVAMQEMKIGEWKEYDNKGKVFATTNYEENFQVTYDGVLDICKKRNIDLTDRLSTLVKSKPGERPMWVVGWNSLPPRTEKTSVNDRSPTTRMEVIVIDAVTGEVRESTPYVPFKVAH